MSEESSIKELVDKGLKVKNYTYGNRNYILFYDPNDGYHRLIRRGVGFEQHKTVFENGGFTTDGSSDANLTTNNITLEIVQNSIKTDIGEAYKKYGGTANGGILPGWIQNKFPKFVANLNANVKDNIIDSGVATDLSAYGTDDKFFGGVGKSAQYPIDALYSTTLSDRGTKDGIVKQGDERQDHLAISQYKYKTTRAEALFGDNAQNALTSGLRRNTPLEKFLGIVKMPMPNDLQDSNNVAWGEDRMNAVEAAGIQKFGEAGLGKLGAFAGVEALGNVFGVKGVGAGGTLLEILRGLNPEQLKNAYGAEATSRILGMAGIEAPAESILARTKGIVPNSNLELLFQSPMLRAFKFVYKMSPRSEDEATVINQIVRFFKQGMAAKKVSQKSGIAGGSSYFLGTPNVFRLQYRTTNNNTPPGVNRIKTCALTGTSINYTPEGTWTSYENGQPTSIILSLDFQELEPIYDTDYMEFDTSSDSVRDNDTTSLGHKLSIKSNEVGY